MTFVIVENLRGFFNSRPPLVVFMICLASFAIALITFAYIVKTKDLPNPDITEDWNTFLEKMSHLKFCGSQAQNVTSHNVSTPSVKVGDLSPGDALESIKDKIIETQHFKDESQVSKRALHESSSSTEYLGASGGHRGRTEASVVTDDSSWSPSMSPLNKGGLINETFHLNVEFVPSQEFLTSGARSVYLTAGMPGNLITMKGSHQDQHIQVTVSFRISESDCVKRAKHRCSMYVTNACITFAGPASVLPRGRQAHTDTCPGEGQAFRNLVRPTSTSLMAAIRSSDRCSYGSSLSIQYSFDDSLTVLLSQEDRSAINLHLMRTSYFLFVMVVTLFCYAAIKGRPGKVKTLVYVQHDKSKPFMQP